MKVYSKKISYRFLAMQLETCGRELAALADRYKSFDRTLVKRIQLTEGFLQMIAAEAKSRRPRDPLPPGQARVMLFLQNFVQVQGRSPTRTEISRGLGYKSNNAAECVLRYLADKGYLRVLPRVTGGIRLRRIYVPPEA